MPKVAEFIKNIHNKEIIDKVYPILEKIGTFCIKHKIDCKKYDYEKCNVCKSKTARYYCD